jgi:hypothetical protein
MTAKEPAVKTADAYYAANIGNVKSIAEFVGNYRLLSYALDAYGLGDQVYSKALITKVLEGGVANPKSLANTLSGGKWKAFAQAFDFVSKGAGSIATGDAIQTTTHDYIEQQFESDQGKGDPGVQLAIYFQRVAPTITSAYGILADKNLLEVVQTIFGLPQETGSTNIDKEAKRLTQLLPISELKDPVKLKKLVERFTAMYDLDYGPQSGATSTLSVVGGNQNQNSSANAASSILAGVIAANGSAISSALASSNSSPAPLFSKSFLQSLQKFRHGG